MDEVPAHHRIANRTGTRGPKRKESRRMGTRARIIDVAQQVFFKDDYFSLSVEDISKMAGLSRAAFYLHFASKDELLVEVIRAEARKLDPLYRWFDQRIVDKASIRLFLNLMFKVSSRAKSQVSLFYLARSRNEHIRRTFESNRDRQIALFAESLPAFQDLGRGPEIERRRRNRVMLLFYQMEQLTELVMFTPDIADVPGLTDVMTDTFYDFLKEFDAQSARGRIIRSERKARAANKG